MENKRSGKKSPDTGLRDLFSWSICCSLKAHNSERAAEQLVRMGDIEEKGWGVPETQELDSESMRHIDWWIQLWKFGFYILVSMFIGGQDRQQWVSTAIWRTQWRLVCILVKCVGISQNWWNCEHRNVPSDFNPQCNTIWIDSGFIFTTTTIPNAAGAEKHTVEH